MHLWRFMGQAWRQWAHTASAAALSAALLIGCGPSQEELDAEKAKVLDLESQLQRSEQGRRSLTQKVNALQEKNDALTQRLHSLGQNVDDLESTLAVMRERERQAEARLATFRNLLRRFKSMIESGELRVRIVRNRMVVELPEGVLFDSGKAKLKDGGKKTLSKVASVLQQIPGRDFQIAGHTDNVPIKTRRFPSNWHLSTRRAVNVALYLIEQKLKSSRLSAAGYADQQPIASNDSKKGRQQNRRIEIVLMPNLNELPDLSSLEKKG